MAITAKDVQKLRQATGAGMMDCKKALQEAEGDFDTAIEILRKKGQKVAAKRADRDVTEGQVFTWVAEDASEAIAFALSCETEPVSNTDEFLALGQNILNAAVAAKSASTEAVLDLDVNGQKAGEAITDLIGKIGEKIEVTSYTYVTGEAIIDYKHGKKIAVLVNLEGVNGADVATGGRDVAMQIAAMNPVAVSEADVDPTIIAKEKELGVDKARQEGKPEKILDRIAEGYVKKFLKDNTLLNQPFVKDASVTVSGYLNGIEKGLTVKSFSRVAIGR